MLDKSLDILEKVPWWIFSDFLKISTDKLQYDTFFDYWIIKKVTAIHITPEQKFLADIEGR